MSDIKLNIAGDTRQLENEIRKTVGKSYSIKIDTKGSQPLGRITSQISEFNKSLEASNARVLAFGASAGIIFGVKTAMEQLATSAINVQKSLQDINVVLNVSAQEIAAFGDSLFSIAKSTGQSFDQVAVAAVEFSRQGLSVEETLKRTSDALILSRLSGLDAAKAVDTLTASVNSFTSEAVTSTEIVNKFANVDAAFAVSSGDLADAISRVGSSAAQSGVSLNELIALVTSAQQTTARGGSVIGNSFKTIFTRLERQKVIDLLGSLGISSTDSSGKIKNTVQLLQDLANVYDGLGQTQKGAVAEAVGGVFQINILKATLQDLGKESSIYSRALQVSASSTDEAIQKNQALNQTYAAQLNILKENAKQLSASVGERLLGPTFERVVGGANSILGTANEADGNSYGAVLGKGIIDGLAQVIAGPGLALIGGVLIKLFKDFTVYAKGSIKEVLNLNTSSKQQADIQKSISAILAQNPKLLQSMMKGTVSVNEVALQLLSSFKLQTLELQKQSQLSAKIASSLYSKGVRVNEGVPTVSTKTKTKADGYIPAFSKESRDVKRGVGGAKSGDKPIGPFNINGEPTIINSGEKLVPDFGGSGETAILTRDMQKSMSMAMGYIPNFAAIGKDVPLEKAVEGFKKGTYSRSQLSSAYGKEKVNAALGESRPKAPSPVKPEFVDLGGTERLSLIYAKKSDSYKKIQPKYKDKDGQFGPKGQIYQAKFNAGGFNPKKAIKPEDEDLVDGLGKFVVDYTNRYTSFFGSDTAKISSPNELANLGSLKSIAGTVFETAVTQATNSTVAQAARKGGASATIDFVNPNAELRSLFNNMPGDYEAKYSESLGYDVIRKGLTDGYLKAPPVEGQKGKKVKSKAAGYIPNFADVNKAKLPFGVRGRINYGGNGIKPNIQLGIGAEESTLAHESFHKAYSRSTSRNAESHPNIGKFISNPRSYAGSGMIVGDRIFKNLNKESLVKSVGLNPIQLDFDGKNPGATYSGSKAIDEIITRIQEKVFKNKGNLDSLSKDEKAFISNLENEGIISKKRLSNIANRSKEGSRFRNLVGGKFSSAMGIASSGFIPNFANPKLIAEINKRAEFNPNITKKLAEAPSLKDDAYIKVASRLGVNTSGLESFLPRMSFPLKGKDKVRGLSKALGFGFARSSNIQALKLNDWNYVKSSFEQNGLTQSDFKKLAPFANNPKGENDLLWGFKSRAEGYIPNFAKFSNQKMFRGIKGWEGGLGTALQQGTSGGSKFKLASADENDIVMTLLGSNFAIGEKSPLIAARAGVEEHSSIGGGMGIGLKRLHFRPDYMVEGALSGKTLNVPYNNLGKMAKNVFKRNGLENDYNELVSIVRSQAYEVSEGYQPIDSPKLNKLSSKLRGALQASLNKKGNLQGLTTNAPGRDDFEETTKYFAPFSYGKSESDFQKQFSVKQAFPRDAVYDLSSISPFNPFLEGMGTIKVGTYKKWSDPEVQNKIKELKRRGIRAELTRSTGKLSKFSGTHSGASGYIPNFSKALDDSIKREKEQSGLPSNKIYISQKDALINAKNPSGLGVFNKRDEGSVSSENKAIKNRSRGYIPNFANGADGVGEGAVDKFNSSLQSLSSQTENTAQAIESEGPSLGTNLAALGTQLGGLALYLNYNKEDYNKSIIEMAKANREAAREQLKSGQITKETFDKIKKFKVDGKVSTGMKLKAGLKSGGGGALAFAAPMIAETLANAIPKTSKTGRVGGAVASGLGQAGAFAGTGAMIGSAIAPGVGTAIGAGVGAAAGALLSLPNIIGEATTDMPELAAAAQTAAQEFNKLNNGASVVLQAYEEYQKALGTDNQALINKTRENFSNALNQLTDEQKRSVLSAGSLTGASEALAAISNKKAKELMDFKLAEDFGDVGQAFIKQSGVSFKSKEQDAFVKSKFAESSVASGQFKSAEEARGAKLSTVDSREKFDASLQNLNIGEPIKKALSGLADTSLIGAIGFLNQSLEETAKKLEKTDDILNGVDKSAEIEFNKLKQTLTKSVQQAASILQKNAANILDFNKTINSYKLSESDFSRSKTSADLGGRQQRAETLTGEDSALSLKKAIDTQLNKISSTRESETQATGQTLQEGILQSLLQPISDTASKDGEEGPGGAIANLLAAIESSNFGSETDKIKSAADLAKAGGGVQTLLDALQSDLGGRLSEILKPSEKNGGLVDEAAVISELQKISSELGLSAQDQATFSAQVSQAINAANASIVQVNQTAKQQTQVVAKEATQKVAMQNLQKSLKAFGGAESVLNPVDENPFMSSADEYTSPVNDILQKISENVKQQPGTLESTGQKGAYTYKKGGEDFGLEGGRNILQLIKSMQDMSGGFYKPDPKSKEYQLGVDTIEKDINAKIASLQKLGAGTESETAKGVIESMIKSMTSSPGGVRGMAENQMAQLTGTVSEKKFDKAAAKDEAAAASQVAKTAPGLSDAQKEADARDQKTLGMFKSLFDSQQQNSATALGGISGQIDKIIALLQTPPVPPEKPVEPAASAPVPAEQKGFLDGMLNAVKNFAASFFTDPVTASKMGPGGDGVQTAPTAGPQITPVKTEVPNAGGGENSSLESEIKTLNTNLGTYNQALVDKFAVGKDPNAGNGSTQSASSGGVSQQKQTTNNVSLDVAVNVDAANNVNDEIDVKLAEVKKQISAVMEKLNMKQAPVVAGGGGGTAVA